jgi:hypothetical protein
MDLEELRITLENLLAAEGVLRGAAGSHPALDGVGRAFGRIARAANRPPRIGILGESNSGKSSLANLLAGVPALPALPVANTRLPALLKYAPVPSVTVVYETGERITLSASENVPRGTVKRLEVGLPSGLLRSVEFLDLPGSSNVLFSTRRQNPASYGIDAAIWTTVATQAWRESERTHWLELPEAIRSRGLLAVTFCDMIQGAGDLDRLHARLEKSAKPYFREICFVAAGHEDLAATATANQFLLVQIGNLLQDFSVERLSKAVVIARRLANNTLKRLGP